MNISIVISKSGAFWSSRVKPVVPIFIYIYYMWPSVPDTLYLLWTVLMYLIGIFFFLAQAKRIFYIATQDLSLLTPIILAISSVFWSLTPQITFSSTRSLLLEYLLAIYLVSSYDTNRQLKLLGWAFILSIVLSFIIPVIVPSYGVDNFGDFGGFFRHKNRLASVMVMSILLFLNFRLYGKSFRRTALPISVLAFILLLVSQGKGSLAFLFVMLPLFIVHNLLRRKDRRSQIFLFIIGFYALALIIFALVANANYIVVDLLHKDFTLTGRGDLWNYLVRQGMTRPWLGFGYNSFWRDLNEGAGVYQANHWFRIAADGRGNAHSGYVELFLQLGWIGIGVVALGFFSTMWRVIRLLIITKRDEFFWSLQHLLLLVLLNTTEVNEGWLNQLSLGWLLYMSISLSTALQIKNAKRSVENPQTLSTVYSRI